MRNRIERLLAPNPSLMTLEGTNTYVIDAGRRCGIVIDPGPEIPKHVEAIQDNAHRRGLHIRAILVTHGHPDHAPAAAMLSRRTGARVWGHPNARYHIDATCRDDERLDFGDVSLLAIDAPGHARDHLVFWLGIEEALFAGDVVVGTGTAVIAPPSGDMREYQATLERLRDEFDNARTIYGGHGPAVTAPLEKINEYIAHRIARERQLLEILARGAATVPELVAAMYATVPPEVWPAAARQVLAYLYALERENRVHSVAIEREATAFERTILDPDLSKIVDAESREFVRAELGIDGDVELRSYLLTAAG